MIVSRYKLLAKDIAGYLAFCAIGVGALALADQSCSNGVKTENGNSNTAPRFSWSEEQTQERDKQIETFSAEIRAAVTNYLASSFPGWKVRGWAIELSEKDRNAFRPGIRGIDSQHYKDAVAQVRAHPIPVSVDVVLGHTAETMHLVARSYVDASNQSYWNVEPLRTEPSPSPSPHDDDQ
jgi:hypothetical protein